MKQPVGLILLVSVVLILNACSNGDSTEDNISEESLVQQYDEKTLQLLEETHRIMPITNPATLAAKFMINMQAEYDPNMLAIDFARPDHYYSSTEKLALNLGRMIVDVVYLDVFDQDSLAIGLIRHMEVMSDSLGIARSFNQFLYMRYIDIMDSSDSTRQMIMEAIEKSKENLRMNNRTKVSSLVTTGEFIETLYITTQILEKRLHVGMEGNVEKELLGTFRQLGDRLELLIELLDNVEDKGVAPAYYKEIEALREGFKEIPNVGDGIMESDAWAEIVEAIAQVRQQIVM